MLEPFWCYNDAALKKGTVVENVVGTLLFSPQFLFPPHQLFNCQQKKKLLTSCRCHLRKRVEENVIVVLFSSREKSHYETIALIACECERVQRFIEIL